MAPLTLEGLNLGKKHQHFNLLVNQALEKKTPFETIETKSGDSDVDELFKIDIASNYRNVEYIIKVLKSEDMLYVSRAIKKSTWLITEDKYSHIINCQYLHEQLFPHMTSKAISKLLLHIRLHLTDTKRGDEFYAYYEAIDRKKAIKWLPNCSVDVIKTVLNKHFQSVDEHLFKKLYEKFPEVLDICAIKGRDLYIKNHIQAVIFILNTDTEKYLDILEKIEQWNSWPKFNRKQTTTIMKKCPERILNKFKLYSNYVDIDTVAKHMQADKIKDFLLTISKNKDLHYWMTYNRIKPFINCMPKEGKFDFLKDVFITKSYKDKSENSSESDAAASLGEVLKSEKIYQWYRHAPFDIAFTDLRKLIKTESSPEERAAIVRIMLSAAGRNTTNILKVIQYYHERHINEAFKFKINFINFLLTVTNTHQFDKSSWKILDELFHSCEVYMESNNSVQHCIEVILVYKLLHNESIPEIIEKKFKFNPLKKIKNKLNKIEKDTVFSYLFNHIEKELNNQSTENLDGVNKLMSFIDDALQLLFDWNKNLADYPTILKKIRELALLKHDKSLNINLDSIYNKKRTWMKYMFEESLLLSDAQKVYINVLKHDPNLLHKYSKQVKAVQSNDTMIHRSFLSKLKIYWSQTLAEEWADAYRSRIDENNGYKALTLGLCGVLPRNELLELFNKYAPTDFKIDWSNVDEHQFSLRKTFAQLMYHSRPQPPPGSILRYAHGDYLQYSLPSLNAIFYNISSQKFREIFPELLKDAVSLQKHGIRIAFTKLRSDELKEILTGIWKSSKNISIRAVIFQLAFNLLCKEKSESKIEEIWEILETFIDNLTDEENPSTYSLLASVQDVPKYIQGKFCKKSYTFLNKLPPKANCQSHVENIIRAIPQIIENIDHEFVAEILLEFIKNETFKKHVSIEEHHRCCYKELLVKYLLNASEADQEVRFDKVIKPWLAQVFSLWDEINNYNHKEAQLYFNDWLLQALKTMRTNLVNKKYTNSRKVFQKILNEIEGNLKCETNYYVRTVIRFLIAYIDSGNQIQSELKDEVTDEPREEFNERYNIMWDKIAPILAIEVIALIKDDMEKLFPSVWRIFGDCISEIYNDLSNINYDNSNVNYVFERELLNYEDFTPAALLAIRLLPERLWDDVKDRKLEQVKILIANHPSLEVRIDYYRKYQSYPFIPLDEEENVDQ